MTSVLDDYWDDDWIEIPTMVNGGAQGVDMICYDWANAQKNIDIILMQAEWSRYGKSAGFKRNMEMLAIGHYVLAFWDGQSRGTRHTIDNALNKGLSTHVHVWRD